MTLYLRCIILASLLGAMGCDKAREIVHESTKPPASATADPSATQAADAAAGATVASGPADASVDTGTAAKAGPDAGPARAATAKATATAKPPPPPALNGLPAGAVCVQGASGNGGCASGSDCTNGVCTCYNGWTSCGGACRDLSRDPYNCDKCGRQCNYGEYCKWGHCE